MVTATYHTDRADVIDLQFSGLKDPLGATPSHPFWSVSRQSFIPAGELVLGEEVVALDGKTFRLTSITPRAGPEPVFNFEVANQHTYYVSRDGLLVHNANKGVYITNGRWFTSLGKRISKAKARTLEIQRAKRLLHKVTNEIHQMMLKELAKDSNKYGVGVTAGQLGKILENRVALDSRMKAIMKQTSSVFGSNGPAFVGKGLINKALFEVTTIGQKAKHLARARAWMTNHVFYPGW